MGNAHIFRIDKFLQKGEASSKLTPT